LNVDLNNPPPGQTYKLGLEKDETDGDRKVRLFKELALFISGLAATAIVFSLCLAVVMNSNTSVDDRKWSMAVLSAAVGAILGYLLKR